jgi:Domain of unknown function (DUF4198)
LALSPCRRHRAKDGRRRVDKIPYSLIADIAGANYMIKILTSVLLGVVFAGPAGAHDFWLQPETFRMDKPGPLVVKALVGHSDDLSVWHTAPSRIIAFNSLGPGGVTDQQTMLAADPAEGTLEPVLAVPGLHVLALTSTHSVSDLPADRFNNYVEEEGVRPILEDRVARGTMKKNGREIYSRRAKSLVLVGDIDAASEDHVTRPIGLTLEIVPLTNPMRASADNGMDFEVRYRGQPVAGALVHVQSLGKDDVTIAPIRTNGSGRARFNPETGGEWMLHTVWSSAILHDPRGDYDTIFSSLTFSFAPAN